MAAAQSRGFDRGAGRPQVVARHGARGPRPDIGRISPAGTWPNWSATSAQAKRLQNENDRRATSAVANLVVVDRGQEMLMVLEVVAMATVSGEVDSWSLRKVRGKTQGRNA